MDKLRAKQERLAARRAAAPGTKGPPIAWGEAVRVTDSDPAEIAADNTTDAAEPAADDDVADE